MPEHRTLPAAAPSGKPGSTASAGQPARGAATLARATQVIAELDQDRWHAHESAIRSFLVEGLQEIDGVTVHQIFKDTNPDTDTIGVVNFSVEGYDAGLVAAYLSAEH
jgi:selenocysteine lyase/cysteine desulfurase